MAQGRKVLAMKETRKTEIGREHPVVWGCRKDTEGKSKWREVWRKPREFMAEDSFLTRFEERSESWKGRCQASERE